jgi:hypothetical protein
MNPEEQKRIHFKAHAVHTCTIHISFRSVQMRKTVWNIVLAVFFFLHVETEGSDFSKQRHVRVSSS